MRNNVVMSFQFNKPSYKTTDAIHYWSSRISKPTYNNNRYTTLLLTATVNVYNKINVMHQKNTQERIDLYLKSIKKYLYKTKFNIVVVENSGYNFNELQKEKELFKNRFEVITFTEKYDLKNVIGCSKGQYELIAINYAYEKCKMLQNASFIIKITCRYFIPELEYYLKNFNLNSYDCLRQYDINRCEMVGAHKKNFKKIFDTNLYNQHNQYTGWVEPVYKKRLNKYSRVLRCKPFRIEETLRGSFNEKFNTI